MIRDQILVVKLFRALTHFLVKYFYFLYFKYTRLSCVVGAGAKPEHCFCLWKAI